MYHIAVGIISVLDLFLNMIVLVVIVSVLISLLGADPNNPIVRMVKDLTEPLYRPFRGMLNKVGPFDFSPLAIIAIIVFLQRGIFPLILNSLR